MVPEVIIKANEGLDIPSVVIYQDYHRLRPMYMYNVGLCRSYICGRFLMLFVSIYYRPSVEFLMPSVFPNETYNFELTEGKEEKKKGKLLSKTEPSGTSTCTVYAFKHMPSPYHNTPYNLPMLYSTFVGNLFV